MVWRITRGRRSYRIFAAAAVAMTFAAGAAIPGVVAAEPMRRVNHGGFERLMVPSSMGPIAVEVQWAARGGSAALYLLDGLRAQDDRNAWAKETNALDQFRADDITVVLPVGGKSSFYANWYWPSNTNGQKITYKWETFLTSELPAFLEGYGVSRTNNAVVGLSMGATAALALAAYHRDQFKYAASFSGYLSLSGPGMREAIRLAMLDAGGFNVDMFAPVSSPQWLRHDAVVFAPQLRGLPMYISAASGLPGPYDRPASAVGVFNTATAMGLEALSLVTTRSFQARLDSIGIPARFEFPSAGTHSWPYWQGQLFQARQGILDATGSW
ncbi:mycolyltransferase [Nocardia brasiliensis]|nr:mycolyltransferase [Nocardia brasiliensis]